MKSFLVAMVIVCLAAAAGTMIWLHRQKEPPAAAPAAESSPERASPEQIEPAPPEKITAPEQERPRVVSADASTTKQPAIAPVSAEVKSEDSAKSPTLSRAIEVLVSPQASLEQKQATWRQLREAEQLDQAIEALKQGAASNAASAEYPTALGEAYLQKAGVVSRKGGNINELGILGMQADQSFDNALKIDPSNWEAQFFKAVSMSYWPAELNKGQEVIQRFSTLIDQQEKMTPQPQFARTYILLGEQYEKMGKADYAATTWQLGAAKFPTDPVLQKKASGQ